MNKKFKGRVVGNQFMPITDASLIDYTNTALPGEVNIEEALDTMILNINSAIVESGSNIKGRYTKYADGSMVQHGRALVPVSPTTLSTGNKVVDLPIKMLLGYSVLFSNIYSYTDKVMWSSARITENSFDIYANCQGTMNEKHYFEAYWTAFGYWKAPSADPYKPVMPDFPSTSVVYENSKFTNLKNAKSALDHLLNDEEYHFISASEWLNGMKYNGLSFWHRKGKLVTLSLNCRYPDNGSAGTIIYKLPFNFYGTAFMYNSYQLIGGASNGAVSIKENGDVTIIDSISPESNLNFIITNIIK